MLPDANVCLLRDSVQALARLTSDRRLPGMQRTVEAIYAGRIDCQTRVRANRAALELVADDAVSISAASEDHDTCAAAEEVVRQLAPHLLDLWEVTP